MPSSEYTKVCKEFSSLSKTIRIETNKERIKFSISDEIGSGSTTFGQVTEGNENKRVVIEVDEPVNQSFSSLYLAFFSKPVNLSEKVTLAMAESFPMIVSYEFLDGRGEIRYYIAPKIEDEE